MMSRDSDAVRAGIEDRLDALFDRVFRLSHTELRLLALAWSEEDGAQRERIWRRVGWIARRQHRTDLIETARATLTTWLNSYLNGTSLGSGYLPIGFGSGMDEGTVRGEALRPIMDAVAAIVAADALGPAERELLYRPMSRLRSRRRRPK